MEIILWSQVWVPFSALCVFKALRTMNCVPEPSMYRPEKIRMGVDVVLHPGFSFSTDPGHSRPTLSRQRSRITKVYVHFMCCSPVYVCFTQKILKIRSVYIRTYNAHVWMGQHAKKFLDTLETIKNLIIQNMQMHFTTVTFENLQFPISLSSFFLFFVCVLYHVSLIFVRYLFYYRPLIFCLQDLAGMIFDHVMQDLLQDEWWKHFRCRTASTTENRFISFSLILADSWASAYHSIWMSVCRRANLEQILFMKGWTMRDGEKTSWECKM